MKIIKVEKMLSKLETLFNKSEYTLDVRIEGNEKEIEYMYKMLIDGFFDLAREEEEND